MRILALLLALALPLSGAESTARRQIVTTTDATRSFLTNETVAEIRSWLTLSTVGTNVYPFNTNQFDVSNTNSISLKTNQFGMYGMHLNTMWVTNLLVLGQSVGYVMSLDITGKLEASGTSTNVLRLATEFLSLSGLTNRSLFSEEWVSKRTDGIDGLGTYLDPRDVSTAAKLSNVVSGVANKRFHFLPGVYSNHGGLVIGNNAQWIGAGMELSILKFNGSNSLSNVTLISATGNTTSNQYLADLTIDASAGSHAITNSAISCLSLATTNFATMERVHLKGVHGRFTNATTSGNLHEGYALYVGNDGGTTNGQTNASFFTARDCVFDGPLTNFNYAGGVAGVTLALVNRGLIDGCTFAGNRGQVKLFTGVAAYGPNLTVRGSKFFNVGVFGDGTNADYSSTGFKLEGCTLEMEQQVAASGVVYLAPSFWPFDGYSFLNCIFRAPTNVPAIYLNGATNARGFRNFAIRGSRFFSASGLGTNAPVALAGVTNLSLTGNVYESNMARIWYPPGGNANLNVVPFGNLREDTANPDGNLLLGNTTNAGGFTMDGALTLGSNSTITFLNTNNAITNLSSATNGQDRLMLIDTNGVVSMITRSNFGFLMAGTLVSTNIEIPVPGQRTTNAHGLGRLPSRMDGYIMCWSNDGNWQATNAILPFSSCVYSNNFASGSGLDEFFPSALVLAADLTNVYVMQHSLTFNSGVQLRMFIPHGSNVWDGTSTMRWQPIATNNWRIKIMVE